LGAAAPVPWRAEDAEKELAGKSINNTTAEAAAKAAVSNTRTLRDNAYKVDLFTNIVKQAILDAA